MITINLENQLVMIKIDSISKNWQCRKSSFFFKFTHVELLGLGT